jgi:hypothetical protein
MAFLKEVTLPSQVVLNYHVIEQVNLPVWQKATSWTKGVVSISRFVNKAAFDFGASPFDWTTVSLDPQSLGQLDYTSEAATLAGLHDLIKATSVDYGDAEIVDL